MNDQQDDIRNSFKTELGRLLFISVGVFLFILFFQPFPLDMLDYNNRLLYVTGFGGIIFLMGFIVLAAIPILIPKWFKISEWESGPPLILSAFLLILSSTAFAFYIRYVGNVHVSLYIMFKIVLVCLLPVIILIILYKNKSLEKIIVTLREQNRLYFLKIKKFEQIGEDDEIEILSENKADKLVLKYRNIIAVKSADNYIEVFYLEKDSIEKKLIRNTLRNIEMQLAPQRSFIRCHRTSIVNVIYIDKMIRGYSGYNLKISYLEDEIPVSRQYLVQVKEAIADIE